MPKGWFNPVAKSKRSVVLSIAPSLFASRNKVMLFAILSERKRSPFGPSTIQRGLLKPPSANTLTSNPAGTLSPAPAGAGVTFGLLSAELVAYGLGKDSGLITMRLESTFCAAPPALWLACAQADNGNTVKIAVVIV